MQISRTVHIQLTEEQTYEALEQYIRQLANVKYDIDLSTYTVEDADSSCGKDGKGAYFLFLKREKKDGE